jgi:hypothetical protein
MKHSLLILIAVSLSRTPAAAQEWKDLESLHRLIIPDTSEAAWQKIPWLTDLREARKKATEEGRPIFLWEMDGHPLGCT